MNTMKKSQLERSLSRSFLLLSAVLIALSLAATLYFDIQRQRREMDTLISGIAAYIAESADVVEMLKSGYPSLTVKDSLDTLCTTLPNGNVVEVCNRDGVRFYHTDRQQSGDSYVDGEEQRILAGEPPYITKGQSTHGTQRRAFHAVENQEGEIIGFVMVSVFLELLSERVETMIPMYLWILGAALLMSSLLSQAVLRGFRVTLMGLQPEELLGRYLRQDVVLSAVSEGLIATDGKGTILFANATVQSMLGQTEKLEGKQMQEVLPESRQEEVYRTGKAEERRSWQVNGHSVLVNEVPLRQNRHTAPAGVLTVLYDRTEVQSMSEELFGAKSMIDALRSVNHEFSNKLHIILGYLETGQLEKAVSYILRSNLVSGQVICETANQVRVSALCALLTGKMMHAAELGISLKLTSDSRFTEQDLLVPEQDLVTILGNLLENAIEAVSASEKREKEIKCSLYGQSDCNIFICEDTGEGIPPEIEKRIFENGFSTKGAYRGTGLSLVQRLVQQYGGEIEVETEQGTGTVFSVSFTREG